MVTFTKVLDTNALKPEIDKAIKDWGAASTSTNTKEWADFSKSMSDRVKGALKTFAKEQFEFAAEMEPLLQACKNMTDQALTVSASIAKEPGATSDRLKLKQQFDAIEVLFTKKMDAAQTLRTGLAAHQGFRGDLFETAKVPSLTGELKQLHDLFGNTRKVCIDKSDALSVSFKKARDEYGARWDQARQRIKDAENAGPGGQTVLAHTELTNLKVIVEEWKNEKSNKWSKLNVTLANMDTTLALKTIDKNSIEGLRKRLPKLKDEVNSAKASLNTDYKRYEAVAKILGKDLYNKALLDQTLVSTVEKGFEKLRAKLTDMQSNLVNSYEDKIARAEKKLK